MQSIFLVIILGATPAADTVVVCPSVFDAAISPWIAHRTAQGHRITVVRTSPDVSNIQRQIREIAQGGRLKYVVLVGDAPPITERADESPAPPLRTVPTAYVPAKINVLWGSEPEIATDNPYADLDDDGLPDLALGRLAVDTPAELEAVVDKILNYERNGNFGPWRRRINLVAGVGGFGSMADKALEIGAKSLIKSRVPAPYETTMMYGSWRSPYCPDPREFHRHAVDRLNEGCLFWVYIGHGHVQQLDRVHVPDGTHHILDIRDIRKLQCRQGLPIAFFMACYTGAFDARVDCLAEEMLCSPGAPVAVIAGSRVGMPYGMSVLATELLDAHFNQRAETLGDVLLLAKRNMVGEPTNDDVRPALDLLAKLISPVKTDLRAERLEHVQLFNLLGDPLLRLPRPQSLRVDSAPTVTAGTRLSVTCVSELAGQATVELVVRRDHLRFKPPSRSTFSSNGTTLAEYSDVYRRANDGRYGAASLSVRPGRFETGRDVPSEARGECQVRVYVEGQEGAAVGSTEVEVVARDANLAGTSRDIANRTETGVDISADNSAESLRR